jgi:hypothetical protein
MSEQEAWLWIANQPVINDEYIKVFEFGCRGLCPAIESLYLKNQISRDVYLSMKDKIKVLPTIDGLYCWPRTHAGWKSRRLYCKKMALCAI